MEDYRASYGAQETRIAELRRLLMEKPLPEGGEDAKRQ